MDSVLGIQYDGGVILAADQMNTSFGVLINQDNIDKLAELTPSSVLGVSGPNCDYTRFTEYTKRNLELYRLRTNDAAKLSTFAQANFCRSELATALRKGPFQCNVLLGGYDAEKGKHLSQHPHASLYWLDYIGTLQRVEYGCQGIAMNFCLSIMDKSYTKNLTKAQALEIIERCIAEIQIRFLPSQPNFSIKCIDKEGISVIRHSKDPADN